MKQKKNKVPSYPRTGEDTKPELCTPLFCIASKIQNGLTRALSKNWKENFESKFVDVEKGLYINILWWYFTSTSAGKFTVLSSWYQKLCKPFGFEFQLEMGNKKNQCIQLSKSQIMLKWKKKNEENFPRVCHQISWIKIKAKSDARKIKTPKNEETRQDTWERSTFRSIRDKTSTNCYRSTRKGENLNLRHKSNKLQYLWDTQASLWAWVL